MSIPSIPKGGPVMNAEQLLAADRLMATVHEYGYACQTGPKHFASELFEVITREVYRLHQGPSYCRAHGVRADEHVGGCAS